MQRELGKFCNRLVQDSEYGSMMTRFRTCTPLAARSCLARWLMTRDSVKYGCTRAVGDECTDFKYMQRISKGKFQPEGRREENVMDLRKMLGEDRRLDTLDLNASAIF